MKIIYTGAARASTPHACATRALYSRVRAYTHMYIHTHAHVERCSLSLRPPIPPYCLSFMGTLLTFYRRAVARISTVFFSSFLFRSLCLSFSVHRFIHPSIIRPLNILPSRLSRSHAWKWFFFFPYPPTFRNVSHGFFDWRLFAFVSLQVSARPRRDTWVENISFYFFFFFCFLFSSSLAFHLCVPCIFALPPSLNLSFFLILFFTIIIIIFFCFWNNATTNQPRNFFFFFLSYETNWGGIKGFAFLETLVV